MIIYNTIVPETEEDLYEETKERFDSNETTMTLPALQMEKLPIQDTAVSPPIVTGEIPMLRRSSREVRRPKHFCEE